MPFDLYSTNNSAKTVAVIGSGVSGLSAAWLLSRQHNVTVYEKAGRLGGHSNTVDASIAGKSVPVDTGFIVFNEPSYPNFTSWLDHLGVGHEESCMSFGVSMDNGKVEYSGRTLSSVFARRSAFASPAFLRMLADIPRFHRRARATLEQGFCAQASLGEFVEHGRYGHGFREYFLKPMAAAIWSTPQMKIFNYPAFSFLRFFENHGLLQVFNLPVWRTVTGGSRSYIDRVRETMRADIRLGAQVVSVRRDRQNGSVRVTDRSGATDIFDDVVIASHGDEARRIVTDLEENEHEILSAFQYQPNKAVLHLDERQMPKRHRAWSSWNYVGDSRSGSVTYWMNRLQNLDAAEDIFVTLNPTDEIDPAKILASFDYDHPMFDVRTEQAQRDIWNIQGNGGVWYAGAHLGHGFHEDGLQSGLAVAELAGGIERPWSVTDHNNRLKLTDATRMVSP